MSNTMCGIASAPVTASVPTTNNAAVMQYANGIKRVANNDTIAIREMVRWLITATESFDAPQMHDDLARIAVQHEKDVEVVLKDLDNYIKTQKPIAPYLLQRLATIKKENVEKIMNVFTIGILTGICQPVSKINLADLANDHDLIVTMSLIAHLHDAIGKRAANEADPDTIPASVADHLVDTIQSQSRFFADQTKDLDHGRALTLDELGWNFRRLADYCDGLEQVLKGTDMIEPKPKGRSVSKCCCNEHSNPDYEGFDKAVSKARIPIPWTPFRMATNHMTNALALLSGLITTAIIAQQKDPVLLESERVMVHEAYQAFLESKNVDKSRKLSTKEQIEMIEANLRKMLSYVECCKSLISKDVQDKDCESQN